MRDDKGREVRHYYIGHDVTEKGQAFLYLTDDGPGWTGVDYGEFREKTDVRLTPLLTHVMGSIFDWMAHARDVATGVIMEREGVSHDEVIWHGYDVTEASPYFYRSYKAYRVSKED